MKLQNFNFLICICLLFFVGSTLIMSCSKKLPTTAEITYHGNQDDVITLSSVGYGTSKKKAILDAEKNAFNVLFFRGVPGSPYTRPLINESESEAKKKKAAFFKQFYNQEGYRNFVVNSVITNPGVKDKRINKTVAEVKISINIVSLRRDLEQNKVIHKFGL